MVWYHKTLAGIYIYIFSHEGQTLMITVGSLQFLGGAPTSICHFFCRLVRPSFCCAPYLRNHTSYHIFGHICELVISVFFCFYYFYFFHFILILIFQTVRPVKGKNSPKWKIKITSVTCHTSGTVQDMIMIFGTLV